MRSILIVLFYVSFCLLLMRCFGDGDGDDDDDGHHKHDVSCHDCEKEWNMITELNGKVSDLNNKLSLCQRYFTADEAKIAMLQKALVDTKSELATEKKQNKDLTVRLLDLNSLLILTQNRLKSAEKKVEKLHKKLNATENKLVYVEKNDTVLSVELQNLTSLLTLTKNQLGKDEQLILHLNQTISKIKAQALVQELYCKRTIGHLQNDLTGTKKELANAKKNNTQLTTDLLDLASMIALTKNQLATDEQVILQLNHTLSKVKAQALVQELYCKRTIDHLRNELKNCTFPTNAPKTSASTRVSPATTPRVHCVVFSCGSNAIDTCMEQDNSGDVKWQKEELSGKLSMHVKTARNKSLEARMKTTKVTLKSHDVYQWKFDYRVIGKNVGSSRFYVTINRPGLGPLTTSDWAFPPGSGDVGWRTADGQFEAFTGEILQATFEAVGKEFDIAVTNVEISHWNC